MSYTIEKADPILLALSGGIASAVCAQVLKDQGFRVEGLAVRFSPADEPTMAAARAAAEKLQIPLREVNAAEYTLQDGPPAPPLLQILAQEADRQGIHYLATGHCARIELLDGKSQVAPALDAAQDQSHLLAGLPGDLLARLCLPIGEFEAGDVAEMARELALPGAESKPRAGAETTYS